MHVVATTQSKTWNTCDATPTGRIGREECERISKIPHMQTKHCEKTKCACPWRHKPREKRKLNGVHTALPLHAAGDAEQIAEWNRLMKFARKAAETMEFARLDPAQCHPMKGKLSQPRRDFDNLDELAESIRNAGQWTPGIVRHSSEKGMFEILSGERRWRAVGRLGDRMFLAGIVRIEDERVIPFLLACLANGNTSPLKPLEMCSAIEELYDNQQMPMEYVAKTIFGISRDKAYAYRRLIHLHDEVKALLAAGKITESDAFKLCAEPHRDQARIAQQLLAGKAMRNLNQAATIPRHERRAGRPSKRPPPSEPIERFLAFCKKLNASADRFEKVLAEIGVGVLKGKPKKQRQMLEEIANASNTLVRCRERLKKVTHI